MESCDGVQKANNMHMGSYGMQMANNRHMGSYKGVRTTNNMQMESYGTVQTTNNMYMGSYNTMNMYHRSDGLDYRMYNPVSVVDAQREYMYQQQLHNYNNPMMQVVSPFSLLSAKSYQSTPSPDSGISLGQISPFSAHYQQPVLPGTIQLGTVPQISPLCADYQQSVLPGTMQSATVPQISPLCAVYQQHVLPGTIQSGTVPQISPFYANYRQCTLPAIINPESVPTAPPISSCADYQQTSLPGTIKSETVPSPFGAGYQQPAVPATISEAAPTVPPISPFCANYQRPSLPATIKSETVPQISPFCADYQQPVPSAAIKSEPFSNHFDDMEHENSNQTKEPCIDRDYTLFSGSNSASRQTQSGSFNPELRSSESERESPDSGISTIADDEPCLDNFNWDALVPEATKRCRKYSKAINAASSLSRKKFLTKRMGDSVIDTGYRGPNLRNAYENESQAAKRLKNNLAVHKSRLLKKFKRQYVIMDNNYDEKENDDLSRRIGGLEKFLFDLESKCLAAGTSPDDLNLLRKLTGFDQIKSEL